MRTSLYVFDDKPEGVLLARYEGLSDEHEAIKRYLKSINKKATNFRFLGELSGMVYRMSFTMDIDNVTNEYTVIVNNLD
jgi:hypothetical protein